MVVNRWVLLLPDPENSGWNHLLLKGHYNGWASRNDIIAHADTTIAYLEANRKILNSRFKNANGGLETFSLPENTIEGECTDITERKKKPRKLLKQLPFFRG